MKKLLGGLLVAILAVSTTFASLSVKEKQQVEKIHTMLSEYGEQLDDVFIDKDYMYYDLKAQREGLVMFIEQALECQGEACMAYNYSMIKDELVEYLQSYLTMKSNIETLNTLEMEKLEDPEMAVLKLQKHMMKIITAGYDLDRPIREKGLANIDFSAFLPFVGRVEADVMIDADSKYDLPKELVDSTQKIEGNITIDPPTEDAQTVAAEGMIHVKMIGEKMYLSLSEIDITGLDSSDDPATQMIATMQSLLGDSYLEIPFSPDVTQLGLATINGAGMRNAIYSDAVSVSMVDFYHQENPFTYYGVPSYNICQTFANLGSMENGIKDCYKRIDDIIVHTDGKGIIVLKEEDGGYNLSLDDKYAIQGAIPSNFLRKPILTRNNDKLQSIDVQLSEDSDDRLKYENNKFTVNYMDDEGTIKIEADVTKERVTGAGSIMMDDIVVTMALDYQKGLIERMNFSINASQGSIEVLSFAMDVEGTVEYIDEFNMIAPENIMTMEELESKMMQTTPLQPETMIEEVQLKITQ